MTLYIQHVGVIGMHWGQRKAANDAYRERAGRLAKSATNKSDKKRFEYANQKLGGRVTRVVSGVVMRVAVAKLLSYGLFGQKMDLSKGGLIKLATKIATNTATNVVINDVLARSASKKYGTDGKIIKKRSQSKYSATREDYAQVGIGVAIKLAPFAARIGGRLANQKLSEVIASRKVNEAKTAAATASKMKDWMNKDVIDAVPGIGPWDNNVKSIPYKPKKIKL